MPFLQVVYAFDHTLSLLTAYDELIFVLKFFEPRLSGWLSRKFGRPGMQI